MDGCEYRKPFIAAAATLIAFVFALPAAHAALFDDFESPQVSWNFGDADVRYQLLRHERIDGQAHSGRRSELAQIAGGAGTFVYLTRDIGSARIVAELKPQVWVKADRPGIQLLARVVLPHTPDPRTGRPAAVLIRGTSYTATGIWQMLQIADTPLLVTRQLRVLQAEMKSPVDGREAYVDQLLLNIYGGPGTTTVNIDDLDIPGIVAREDTGSGTTLAATGMPLPRSLSSTSKFGVQPVSNSTPSPAGGQRPQISLDGSLLEIDGRPIFPRIVQWRGEPLTLLKSLGFNAVRSCGPLTESMLEEAERAGIWLIGPPPVVSSQVSDAPSALGAIGANYDRVIAWHLGSSLASRELSGTTQLAKQLRQADRQLRRPLVCGAEENVIAFSRLADLLTVCRCPLASSLELNDYRTWLAQRPRVARPGTPIWTVVQTEPATSVIEQVAQLSANQSPEPQIDFESLRLVAYQAFSAGARGIEFASNSRLDAGNSATRSRATALALLNLELDLLQPWEAAGNVLGNVSSNDPTITGVVLSADNARLVVALRCPPSSQFVAAPANGGTSLPPSPGSIPLSLDKSANTKSGDGTNSLHSSSRLLQHGTSANGLQSNRVGSRTLPDGSRNLNGTAPAPTAGTWLVVPGIPEDNEFYELTPVGLAPVRHQRRAGGTAITIDDFALTTLILITPDPLVANAMSRRAAAIAPQAARLEREMAENLLAEIDAVDRRLVGQSQFPRAAASVAAARAELERADQLLAAGNAAEAYRAARNAMHPLGRWKREAWERAVKPLATPLADPLVVCFNTLPDELMFRAAMVNATPGANVLPGGDCENLVGMLQAGWQRFDHPQPGLQNFLELSPYAPYGERMTLHMEVRPSVPEKAPPVVESPPLWITSAPVRVEAGELVCIRGKIRMPTPVAGSVDSLMVIESLGGEALAQRIAPADGWREFVMYRAAPRPSSMTVTFALTGIGEAWIDNVTIQPVNSKSEIRNSKQY